MLFLFTFLQITFAILSIASGIGAFLYLVDLAVDDVEHALKWLIVCLIICSFSVGIWVGSYTQLKAMKEEVTKELISPSAQLLQQMLSSSTTLPTVTNIPVVLIEKNF